MFRKEHKKIWHNLYEFPVIETEQHESTSFISEVIQTQFSEIENIIHLDSETVLHKLSHQHLHINFWKIHTKSIHKNGLLYNEILQLPVPIVIHNFIERNSF